MRGQGSIEFIIILAAVAALSVSILALYSHTQAAGDAAYNAIANYSLFEPANEPAAQPDPFLYAYLSNTTYVNRSNGLSLLAYLPENYSLQLLIGSSDGSALPANYFAGSRTGFTSIQGSLVPTAPGPYSVTVRAEMSYRNGSFSRNLTLESYALAQPNGATTTIPGAPYLYASILRHNESLIYSASSWGQVYNMTITDRCSEENFFYQQLPIWVQCGSAHWYFFVFSDQCYSQGINTATYCVYLNANRSSYSQPRPQPAYAYNITLDLYQSNVSGQYSANLTSSSPNAILYRDGKGYGYAFVTNSLYAVSPFSYQNELFLNLSGDRMVADASGYAGYQQALTSAESTLAYYNNSDEVGDAGLQSVQEAIAAFNTQAYRFTSRASPANIPGCGLSQSGNYDCAPVGAFDYGNITARINGDGGSNETLDVDGSVIHLGR